MAPPALRWLGAVLALGLVAVGVYALRDATMSTHTRQDPDSRLAVVIDADVHGAEAGQTLSEYTKALVLSCRTEVAYSDLTTGLHPVADHEGRFRFVLQPSLDDTDRNQFQGCLEDWNLDHLQIDVVSMQDLPPATGDEPVP